MNTCEYKEIKSIIPYTTMKILIIDGVEVAYYITPYPGYKLHAKELDEVKFDEETLMETDEIIPGYTSGVKTCHINYDFIINERQFYAIAEEDNYE